jgi:hypothetical protein
MNLRIRAKKTIRSAELKDVVVPGRYTAVEAAGTDGEAPNYEHGNPMICPQSEVRVQHRGAETGGMLEAAEIRSESDR